jgi:hypothetical protein
METKDKAGALGADSRWRVRNKIRNASAEYELAKRQAVNFPQRRAAREKFNKAILEIARTEGVQETIAAFDSATGEAEGLQPGQTAMVVGS